MQDCKEADILSIATTVGSLQAAADGAQGVRMEAAVPNAP